MNEYLDPSAEGFSNEELDIERALRPVNFDDFTGQEQVLENLKVFVEAANRRGEALDHTLFHGPPGLGKTTLANILANELGVKLGTYTHFSNSLHVYERHFKMCEQILENKPKKIKAYEMPPMPNIDFKTF